VIGKIPPFSALTLQTKVKRPNDVGTEQFRCISHIQYWTAWNEVEKFECSRINNVETKQGISNEYQSNFTSMAKRKSKPLIRPFSMCFKSCQDVMWKYPHFRTSFCKPKSYLQNDVETALIRCISHFQYWTVWNEVQTFEYSRIHIVETKQGSSSEFQSNFTSMAERKSKASNSTKFDVFLRAVKMWLGKYPHFRL
jgi:hypothetical protein